MATKPTILPRWATGGTAQIVEPAEGKKDTGWVPGEQVPAQTLNWWQRYVGDWLAWLNDLTNQALTWVGAAVFSGSATFNGTTIVTNAPTAATHVVRKQETDAEAATRAAADTAETNARVAAVNDLDTRVYALEGAPRVVAWAHVVNNAGVLSVTSYNIASISYFGGSPYLHVTFTTPPADGNYSVVVTPYQASGSGPTSVEVTAQLSTDFQLILFNNTGTGLTWAGPTPSALGVNIAVFR